MKCDSKSWSGFLMGLSLAACGGGGQDKEQVAPDEVPAATCSTLFGVPSENTGLEPDQCMPRCTDCETHGAFVSPDYSSEDLVALREAELENPPDLLDVSPYLTPDDFPLLADQVCGLIFESGDSYRLETFSSTDEAEAAGARVTHEGACGACSSLRDLAVYIEVPDLTTPVRRCGVMHLAGTVEDLAECISELGFTPACSQIWAYNSLNTRELCLQECISALDAPYHQEDSSPNECIQCDEEKSGPVFKAVSGRTRRNSGLPTALCRPCEGLSMLEHHYFED